MSCEAGGLNSTTPFTVAAELGIPLVDADMMGRAFPELQMCTPTLYGVTATPMAIADEKGNSAVINTIRQPLDRDAGADADDRHGLLGDDRHLPDDRQAGQRDVRAQHDLACWNGSARPSARRASGTPIRSKPCAQATNGYLIWRGKVGDVAAADGNRLRARRGSHRRRRRVRRPVATDRVPERVSRSPKPTTTYWRRRLT